MGRLTFIGLGLRGASSLPLGSLPLLRRANQIFLERYTSPLEPRIAEQLRRHTASPLQPVSREIVEDGHRILDAARQGHAILLVPGDPMIATTHTDLLLRAREQHLRTDILHNASILTALPGATGLHAYKFGPPVTVTRGPPPLPITVYRTVRDNLLRGLHSLLLLEYDAATHFFLAPSRAFTHLLAAERERRQHVFIPETLVLVASRIGHPRQRVIGGALAQLRGTRFGSPPHTLIIPGPLHFTEEAALHTLVKLPRRVLRDNSRNVRPLATELIPSYAAKTRTALARAREQARQRNLSRLSNLFENVEAYIADAERFLRDGPVELAMLSIGYGEGLLDALRLTDTLDIRW